MLDVGDLKHGQHGSKDLLLRQVHLGAHVGEDGRREIGAAGVGVQLLAAGRECRPLRLAAL